MVAFDRKGLDLSRPEIIDDRLLPIEFDVVINAAAATSVDYCEKHPEEATQVNADGPARVAEICARRGAKMVQISTDYVYDGSGEGLKSEESATRPLGVYAATKLAAENAVLSASPRHLVLRTAWVFGPDRQSFVDSILEKAAASDLVQAIDDKFASPTYSNDFGAHLEALLRLQQCGIFNLSNDGICSWWQFARTALDIAIKMGLPLKATSIQRQKLASMTTFLAPRPVYTAMSLDKLERATGHRPRSWESALADYLETFYSTTADSGTKP